MESPFPLDKYLTMEVAALFIVMNRQASKEPRLSGAVTDSFSH